MSSCLPCAKLRPEVSLLNDCYPPPKQLQAAGPEYRPLSQDLSKLTYSARNKSSLLPKVGEELEGRVKKEAQKSTGGYPRSRASLLISLAILKALVVECKNDLALFARHIVRIVSTALDVKIYQQNALDLEVVGRAASAFIAFCTFTDGTSISADSLVANTYLTVLRKFATMALDPGTAPAPHAPASEKEHPDTEMKSRTRLIALAALNGAASSDAMFSSTTEFPRQANILIPPLMANIYQGTMSDLKLETAKLEMDASPSPFFSEFSARRPVNDRRAPSLHAHVPGEKSPSTSDVLGAALRSLKALFGHCQITQASHVLDAVFGFLDQEGWRDVERSCWLAERLTGAMMLQYRFVVPTKLVELLNELPDGPAGPKHMTALAMVTTILNSSISLVGLAVTDLANSLVTLIIRRIQTDSQDGLLPPLVQCISSLGTHIYYSDQINDIVEELAIRISQIPPTDKDRPEILRVLIHCITGVMTRAKLADEAEGRLSPPPSATLEKGKAPQVETPLEAPRPRAGRRNPVAPEVWQETLALLCEASYPVRAAYARALILYLQHEMPRSAKHRPSDLTGYRFCNALHAAIYTLAMSSCLGAGSPDDSPTGTPAPPSQPVLAASTAEGSAHAGVTANGDGGSARSRGVKFNLTEATPSGTPQSNGTATPPHTGTSTPPRKNVRTSRRVSLPLNRVNSAAILSSYDNVATPFDFAAIIKILEEAHAAQPVAALLTGVPMLLALDKDAGSELVRRPGDGRSGAWVLERKRAIRETVSILWIYIGRQWDVPDVINLARKALDTLPEPLVVPNMQPEPEGQLLPAPEETVQFYPHSIEGESSATSRPLVDPESIVAGLAASETVQAKTGKETATLIKRWTTRWTVETALKDSVERFSSAQIRPPQDNHLDVAKVLMNIDNSSYHSFAKQMTRPVDVTDLREALGQRKNSYVGSAAPSLVSTTVTGPLHDDVAGATKKRQVGHGSADVKDVLRDIFEKKGNKRGAGARPNGHAAVQSVGTAGMIIGSGGLVV